MKVRVLRTAFNDLVAGSRFYDRQSAGVGAQFLDSLFSEIDSLVLHAGVHRVHHGFHRMLARRFPYAIYYRVIGNEAVVFRVLDCRREPRRIRGALERSG